MINTNIVNDTRALVTMLQLVITNAQSTFKESNTALHMFGHIIATL